MNGYSQSSRKCVLANTSLKWKSNLKIVDNKHGDHLVQGSIGNQRPIRSCCWPTLHERIKEDQIGCNATESQLVKLSPRNGNPS